MKVGEVKTVVPFEFDTEERNVLIRAEEIIHEMIDMLNTGELDHFEDENNSYNMWDACELMELANNLEVIRSLNLANTHSYC